MTEDEVRSRVDIMVDRIRLVWIVITIASMVYVVTNDLAWWFVLLSWFGCVIGFNIHVSISAFLLARTVMNSGGIIEKTVEEVEILDTCSDFVGRYFDFDVPEWIDVKVGSEFKRYVFKDFAPRIGDSFGIPSEGDRILYRAGIFQPAQGE